MSVISDLRAIGWFAVGVGGDASAQYPVLSMTERHEPVVMGAAGRAMRRLVIEIDSYTIADGETVNQMVERLRDELERAGEQVRINEFAGSARIIGAGGAPGGALPGQPQVRFETDPSRSVGAHQFFRASISADLPAVETDQAVHEWTRQTDTDEEGLVSVRQSGRARTPNGASAQAWIEANVITPASDAAAANGRRFRSRITVTLDQGEAQYEYADSPPGPLTFAGGVTDAQVSDVTAQLRPGRRERTVSGWAEGPGAASFALDQKPNDPNLLIQREEISQPQTPSGRVSFTFRGLAGFTAAPFPGVTTFSFTQSIEDGGGGRSAQAAAFDSGPPLIWLGPERAYTVAERSELVFRGDWSGAVIPPALDESLLAARPRISREDRSGVRTLRIERIYIAPAEQPLPAPLEVSAL